MCGKAGDYQMKKIVLCGLNSDTNLGDPLLVDCTKWLFNQVCKEEVIQFVEMNFLGSITKQNIREKRSIFRKNIFKSEQKVISIVKHFISQKTKTNKKIKEISAEYKEYYMSMLKEADLLVFLGGGTIKYHVRLDFGPYYGVVSECAEELGIPCVINCVGIESNYNANDYRCKYFSEVLSRDIFKVISTRDNIDELKKYVKNQNTDVKKIADIGTWSSDVFGIQKKESKKIGLGIITYKRFEEFSRGISKSDYEKILYDIIQYFSSNSIEWEMFTNGDYEDNLYAEYLHNKFCCVNRLIVPKTTRELVETISNFQAIISSRLHSCIVAYSLDVPYINIAWNNKNAFFSSNINCLERIIDKHNLNISSIIYKLEKAMQEKYDNNFRLEYKRTNIELIEKYLQIMEKRGDKNV